MKRQLSLLALLSVLSIPSYAADGLDSFLNNVNIQARGNIDGFALKLSAQFGISDSQVRIVLSKVSQPSDAFMIFQLGQMSRQPIDRVLSRYQASKGRGWGALAQDLGIKPGSSEFHALKRGDLKFGIDSDLHENNSHENNSHGRGRGKNKF